MSLFTHLVFSRQINTENSIFTMANPLNVYKGPDSVRSYFHPDSAPPLPLVEVPDCLNPYRKDGVRIYAKMMSMHPANNVKSMPGLSLQPPSPG
ncbi:hypothetical protein IMZ48_12695 [Candidatus Bathyarchaeota archaeon]|nr:hypothetical protein [Candidatus Bathyarchaeota archaeon]